MKAFAVAAGMGMAQVAIGAPGEILSSPAPVIGADAPKGVSIGSGDAKVSPQTGAFEYSYSIAVPPGRAGMQPSITLGYSSQAPRYGTLASGWTLSFPTITRDYSRGHRSVRWKSSMAGGRELVKVNEPLGQGAVASYRAQADSSYARYEQLTSGLGQAVVGWRVRQTDGMVHVFGGNGAPQFVDWFPLTRSVDSFGNEIRYEWEEVTGGPTWAPWRDARIARILYTGNPGAHLPHHADVTFLYDDAGACHPGVGGQMTYDLDEKRLRGASKLISIQTRVRSASSTTFEKVRKVELVYDADAMACDQSHAPARILNSIREVDEYGSQLRPAVTFAYGALGRVALAPLNVVSRDDVPASQRIGAGRRFHGFQAWSSLDSQLMDVNADGRPDRLYQDQATPQTCTLRWDKNMPTPGAAVTFRNGRTTTSVPVIPWASVTPAGLYDVPQNLSNPADYGQIGTGEDCSLSGQYSLYQNKTPPQNTCYDKNLGHHLVYRFLDVDADGKTDLLTALHYDANYYEPQEVPRSNTPADPAGPTVDLPDPPTRVDPGPACPVIESTCLETALDCAGHDLPCHLDDAAVAQCVYEAPREACHLTAVELVNDGLGPLEAPHDLNFQNLNPPHYPPDPNGGVCKRARTPEGKRGQYVWRMYRGLGDGTFDVAKGEKLIVPIPLSAASGDPVGQGGNRSTTATQTIMDIDGDGYIDLVHDINPKAEKVVGLSGKLLEHKYWWVWFGDGTGTFRGGNANPDTGGDMPYLWQVPVGAVPTFSVVSNDVNAGRQEARQLKGLIDVNGDGRPDFLRAEPGHLLVHYNTGTGFRANPEVLMDRTFYLNTSSHDSRLDERRSTIGGQVTKLRATDVDGDGRVDWYGDDGTGQPRVWRNTGVFFRSDTSSEVPDLHESTSITVRIDAADPTDAGSWTVARTALDLDGDGRTDAVRTDGTSEHIQWDGTRAGLMRSVDNGRGLTTTVAYAPHVDKNVVKSGKSPRSTWVVKSIETVDAHAPLAAGKHERTTYTYHRPVFNADDSGRHAFRGFKQTRAMGARGAITVSRFSYAMDWSGRGIGSETYASEATRKLRQPHAVSRTTWKPLSLFAAAPSGGITTYHTLSTRAWTCRPGQTVSACRDTGHLLRTMSEWKPLAPAGQPAGSAVMHVQKRLRTYDHQGAAERGDWMDTTTHALYYDANVYRVRPVTQERRDYDSTTGRLSKVTGRTTHHYSAGGRFETQTETWQDAVRVARTVRTFDAQTGNALTTIKPQQHADGSAAATSVQYDALKIYPSRVTNELGHVVETDTDYRTGKVLVTRGPNTVSCGAGCTQLEESRFVLDVHGRTLETWKQYALAPGSGVALAKVATSSYEDFRSPQRVTTTTRVSGATAPWATTVRTFDGHGRVTTHTTKSQGTAPVDAVMSYVYDEAGALVRATVPDASTNDSSTVDYTYTYDSLGRATGILRPNGSGIRNQYRGLRTTRTECIVVAGQGCLGPASHPGVSLEKKRIISDVHGRLVRVKEKLDDPAGSWATWRYRYDSKGQLERVRDPDGITTTLAHDWAGHRTSIARASGTWSYIYDLNGNTLARTEPVPVGADASLYTSTFAYDELDRQTSRLPAQRNLDNAQLKELAVGPVRTIYDTAPHGIGRVASETRWTPIVDASSPRPQPLLRTEFSYDPRGNVTEERRSFNLAPVGIAVSDSRTIIRHYNAVDKLDGMAFFEPRPGSLGIPSVPLAFEFTYDARGLPC